MGIISIAARALVVLVFVGFAASYYAESGKYQFQTTVQEGIRAVPGTRLIGATRSSDLVSPVAWVWPPITALNYAQPDPVMKERFTLFSFRYKAGDPGVFLLDVDCKERSGQWYGPNEPASAQPAKNAVGQPVVASDHKTFRRMMSANPVPAEWMHAFCDTDWSAEKTAVAESLGKKDS